MSNIDVIEALRTLGPYAASLAAGSLSYALGRKKSTAEAILIANKAEKEGAETERYRSETGWGVAGHLEERMEKLEGEMKKRDEQRALLTQRIEAKNLEISILKEQLEGARALTDKYRKIAIMLQEQLERA